MRYSASLPLNDLIKVHSFKPKVLESSSSNFFKNTRLPLSVLNNPYSNSGFKQIAKLAGKVQGVVVQITKYESPSSLNPLPSVTLNLTKMVLASTS